MERFDESARDLAYARVREHLPESIRHLDSIEVNLFRSESEEMFRRTHARYFRTTEDLLAELLAALESA